MFFRPLCPAFSFADVDDYVMSELSVHALVSIELMKSIFYFTGPDASVVSPHYSTSPEASVVSPFSPTESPCQMQLTLGVEVSLVLGVKHSSLEWLVVAYRQSVSRYHMSC